MYMQKKRHIRERIGFVQKKKLSFGVNIFGHYAVIRLKLQL